MKNRKLFVFLLLLEGLACTALFLIASFMDERLIPPSLSSIQFSYFILESASKESNLNFPELDCEGIKSKCLSFQQEINIQKIKRWYSRDFSKAGNFEAEMHTGAIEFLKTRKLLYEQLENKIKAVMEEVERRLSHIDNSDWLPKKKETNFYIAQSRLELSAAKSSLEKQQLRNALTGIETALEKIVIAENKRREIISRFSDPSEVGRWQKMISDAIRKNGSKTSLIIVVKAKHRLDFYIGNRKTRSMTVDIGANTYKDKLYSGDRATPEGMYKVTVKKSHGYSKYGLALLINYPNEEDKKKYSKALKSGEIPKGRGIGGLIEIHGKGGRGHDWTDGCIAPDDKEMEWLFKNTNTGTKVLIVGTDEPVK